VTVRYSERFCSYQLLLLGGYMGWLVAAASVQPANREVIFDYPKPVGAGFSRLSPSVNSSVTEWVSVVEE